MAPLRHKYFTFTRRRCMQLLHKQHCLHTRLWILCTCRGLKAVTTKWHIRAKTTVSIRFPSPAVMSPDLCPAMLHTKFCFSVKPSIVGVIIMMCVSNQKASLYVQTLASLEKPEDNTDFLGESWFIHSFIQPPTVKGKPLVAVLHNSLE